MDSRISQEDFENFINHRIEKKKPLTEVAITRAINKLNRLAKAGYDCRAIIDKTIVSGWLDFYEPKDKPKKKNPSIKDLDDAYEC